MNKRQVLLLVALLALVVASFPGIGARAQNKSFKIGVSNGFVSSEWRTQMIQDLQDVAKEYTAKGIDITLDIESADTDVPGQIQQIQNLVNRKVNALIIDPNNNTALNSAMQDAVDAGIVVISVDQEVAAKGVYNVVIDQTEWARISARWLAEQLGGKGNIVEIEGIKGHPANEGRMNGVKDVLSKYPDIKVIGDEAGNWDQATGQKVMSDFLASLPNIDGVWTQDGMALGALTAIQTANPKKWPVMVGEARTGYIQLWHSILATKPDFTSFGVVNPPGAAPSGMRVAIELLNGAKVDPSALGGDAKNSLYIPIPYIVDKTNFDAIYKAVANLPASYVLDGIISQEDAVNLIAGKLKLPAPTAMTNPVLVGLPQATPAATMAATAAK